MQLSIWCNNNFKHLNVIIMMRRTCSRLCNFNENVDKSIMKHLSPWWKERVPRRRIRKWCHGNIPVPVLMEVPVQKEVWRERVMQGWWGAPDYGVPTCQCQGKRRATCTEQLRHGVNTSISYNTQHSFTGVVSGLYLWSVCCRNGPSSMRCRGSGRSRDVRSGSRGTWRR